jgi:hypothetical protein
MATDYAAGRQRDHLAMSDDEFNRRLAAIEAAFGVEWLTTSVAALSMLWQRKDGFAVNQLCLVGDAIAGFKLHRRKAELQGAPPGHHRSGGSFA